MALNSSEGHRMLDASRRHAHLVAQIVPSPMTLAFDRTIGGMIGSGYVGDLISLDAQVAAGSASRIAMRPISGVTTRPSPATTSARAWVSGMKRLMRWVGPMKTVMRSVRVSCGASSGQRPPVPSSIPDHVDITGEMEQGGQMRLNVTTVAGLAACPVDIHVFGTEGAWLPLRARW